MYIFKKKNLKQQLLVFLRLMRFNRPAGTVLLLWPTLWALWLSSGGPPTLKNFIIFTFGVVLMRAAGCVINDVADRKIDGHIERTRDRPIPCGFVSIKAALVVFFMLCAGALALVMLTNNLTLKLSCIGIILATSYPFMKRYTHLPQVFLGTAFAWSVPMVFAAVTNRIDNVLWWLYSAVVIWTIAYDTFYAMVDRADDLKIGVKSTAILFGKMDRAITACLQGTVLGLLTITGVLFERGEWFYCSLIAAAALFIYQQYIIRNSEKNECFKAFLNNNYVGAVIFIGLALDYQAI
ncbi:MAG: 4-hydroxybenzoate octaprenyltransferase [Porticoccus sp.]|jgi:4-hydroxybenzoate polyprenyltransferase|tara:strand:- start:9255 stop:10136 length:882 start_codon:yes stop_codon:yes gene_type:complete